MVETGIVTYLLQQSSITDLIGKSLQPIPAPPDLSAYPLVTYQTVSYVPEYANDGPTGFAQKRLVFNCWAAKWLQAHTILEALRGVLSGYSGTLPDGTRVYLIEIDGAEDLYDDNQELSCASLHVLVQYAE